VETLQLILVIAAFYSLLRVLNFLDFNWVGGHQTSILAFEDYVGQDQHWPSSFG
jgi:hypothetical protein